MRRIYTKGGDKGMTGLHGGDRVPKDNVRIHANGELDELNCCIGVARSFMPGEDERHELLYAIQKELMVVMSIVATPLAKREGTPNGFDEELIDKLERAIDV